jgi:glycine oxidase ThiO
MSENRDILIVGGGAIGLAIALELSLQGASVTVLSRNFAEAALHAAAGMLAPEAEGLAPGPMRELCLRSRALYPDWVAKLESLSGMEVEYWPCGILTPLYGDDLKANPTAQARPEWCDRDAVAALQPRLSEAVVGGWWFPDDGQINNQNVAQALRLSMQHLGVNLCEGVTVERILCSDAQVTGVKTSAGLYQAGHYVLAAGAWSGNFLGLPVQPRKGQMLAVRTMQPQPLQHVLFGTEVYIVPRRNGQVVIGATNEAVGFTLHNTPAGLQTLLNAALRLYPPFQDWIFERQWYGFRPTAPDELPLLGPSPYTNLTLATGHHRNGILLMPITAQVITDWVLHGTLNPLIESFHWCRWTTTWTS